MEKIFLLHEEYQRPQKKPRIDRLSRHLYDIYQIAKTGYADKSIRDKLLYETIVKHRYNFTRWGGVNYNLHNPQSINFIPPEEIIKEWEADYKIMQEQMIYGNSPDFGQLLETLYELMKKMNDVGWKMETKFPVPDN